MRKLIASAAVILLVSGASAPAYAGEVTGGPNPKSTPAGEKARSICAFSGQEDGITLIGFEQGVPIFIEVETGPGLVQTPHHENSAEIIHAPGIPGDACRGNLPSDE